MDLNNKIGRVKREGAINGPALPVLGDLKIGEVAIANTGGVVTEQVRGLDHFKATGKYSMLFHKYHGELPNSVEVYFISDNNEKSCNEQYMARDKDGRKMATSDGITCQMFDNTTQQYVTLNVEEDRDLIAAVTEDEGLTWELLLTLYFIVPQVKDVLGVWRFRTKGAKSSIEHIIKAFDYVKENAGFVVNIPFNLSVQMAKNGEGEEFPAVQLIPLISMDDLVLLGAYREAGGDIAKIGRITQEKISIIKKELNK